MTSVTLVYLLLTPSPCPPVEGPAKEDVLSHLPLTILLYYLLLRYRILAVSRAGRGHDVHAMHHNVCDMIEIILSLRYQWADVVVNMDLHHEYQWAVLK